MLMERERARALGLETLAILEARSYRAPAGHPVALGERIDRARAGTRSYAPDDPVPRTPARHPPARVTVDNRTTLDAARGLVDAGRRPAALNFASGVATGGGWLSGSRAQEESLFRSSALHACLAGDPMYAYHRWQRSRMRSSWTVYTPDVPVFRTDDGALIDEPWNCAFLTCSAVEAHRLDAGDDAGRRAIAEAMAARIDRVLSIAAAHGHDSLVLGAWGCGAFGNDPATIAALFRDAIAGPHAGAFAAIVFAITDWSDERRFLGPFADAFGVPRT